MTHSQEYDARCIRLLCSSEKMAWGENVGEIPRILLLYQIFSLMCLSKLSILSIMLFFNHGRLWIVSMAMTRLRKDWHLLSLAYAWGQWLPLTRYLLEHGRFAADLTLKALSANFQYQLCTTCHTCIHICIEKKCIYVCVSANMKRKIGSKLPRTINKALRPGIEYQALEYQLTWPVNANKKSWRSNQSPKPWQWISSHFHSDRRELADRSKRELIGIDDPKYFFCVLVNRKL